MRQVLEFYTGEKKRFEILSNQLKKKLAFSSTIRLVIFLISAFGIYFFFGNPWLISVVGLLGFGLFLYLVSRHTDLSYKYDLVKKLVELNNIEIAVLNGNYLDLDTGSEFMDSSHFYSYDIDLFGRGSLFQYMNRTAVEEGKIQLFRTLTNNDIANINLKQEAIKELAAFPKWRQKFSAIASLVKVRHSAKAILKWIHNYKAVFPVYLSYVPLVFSIVSVLLTLLVSIGVFNYLILVLWFFIGLGVSSIFFKQVNAIYKEADKAKDTFKQYHKLLYQIETVSFEAQDLTEAQTAIQTERKKASEIFASFSKTLDALDQRNNVIIAVLGNAFFLRDTQLGFKVEQWITTYAVHVEKWFEVIAFFDAQNSLANMAFNHPEYAYPEIESKTNTIQAKLLGHPLLERTQRVDNNFDIKDAQFFIITGANMAGKSTFLRTVSLAIIMANMGLPVCAQSFTFAPIKLITSMRTSDSLTDDESYFFSELKRLKFIVEAIKTDTYFIILDEILKGTNSTDKAIGSKKFVQKLVASNSSGIIATHDLSLCQIEKELSAVENYFFDAEIINDELHFDFKFKEGICKNMNASFLLKKMEII